MKKKNFRKSSEKTLSELDQNEFVLKYQNGITSKLLMVCGSKETENFYQKLI